jgi:hypothetical protein
MCFWVRLAAINLALALGLAVVFKAQNLSDIVAIALITAALSLAQLLYWMWVCGGFRR